MPERVQHTKVNLPMFKKSFALMSEAPVDTIKRAIIFVHGFNGSARSTWTDFLSLVDDSEACSDWWEPSDLYFCHYQWASVFHSLINNSLYIYKFVRSVFPLPTVLRKGNAYRDAIFRYKELILVGHSEGGLLLRKVIIKAAERDKAVVAFMTACIYTKTEEPKCTDVLLARIRLFAPALGGEMQTGLIGILTSLPIVSHGLSASAARKGMNPASAEVTQPREITDEYAKFLPFDCFKAHILWAERDSIISGEKYKKDEECINPPVKTSHTSVCKPTANYPLPLNFVEEGVARYECQLPD
jgi:pimeloyl-ACP methyl ester carboxylesterase